MKLMGEMRDEDDELKFARSSQDIHDCGEVESMELLKRSVSGVRWSNESALVNVTNWGTCWRGGEHLLQQFSRKVR